MPIIHAVILAAGKGTRMYSDSPKVLHQLGGLPMLEHVIRTARQMENVKLHVVTGFGSRQICDYFTGQTDLNWVTQEQQLGTGHAVAQAMPFIPADDAIVLVLCGDVPLIKASTIAELVNNAGADSMSLLTLITETPFGLGRILRGVDNHVQAIVEEKDADDEQRRIKEINTGIMAIPAKRLSKWLSRIDNRNKQGEYYLTDVIALAVADDCAIHTKVIHDHFEVQGINDKYQLALLERHYQMNKAEELAKQGTTLRDPARIDIRGELICGRDVEIDVNAIFEGKVRLGDRVHIGPNVVIRDSDIAADSEILANSHIEGASIGAKCQVGPFARLRPGAVLREGAKIGNFVEIKASIVGKGSRANHFAYIGDAEIGAGTNIGAGTIFCNYDGAEKHKTIIGDGVFIGSNSTLVAPVTIAANAFVAAGSTVNGDVPAGNLAVGRGKQRNISGWKRPQKRPKTE
ncbi:MAG: bifunctional UDP-N-acetylglucosamine diphosphorylase/glucosamine-1-phosphate N-acetyltransferase GlmU [Pseudohongiellaceae bacterium]